MEDFTPEEKQQFEAMRNEQEIPEAAPEAPEVQPEAQEEVKAEVQEEVPEKSVVKEEPKEEIKTVPLKALHEERNLRKELKRENQELREKLARLDERQKMLTKQEEATDPEDDKFQSILDKQRQLEEEQRRVAMEASQLRIKTVIADHERAFEKNNPDYYQALDFAINQRKSLLEDLGFEDEDLEAKINEEFQSIVQNALKNGRNPAEAAYKMAQKLGFKSQQEKKEEKKIDTLQKGATAAKSLSQSSGKGTAELTAEALAEMSDEEFAKVDQAAFRKVFGG